MLANACLAKGIGGLVTDSGVRDTMQLRELGFPVFSLSVSIKGTVKETLTSTNDPIVIGGELVHPGDIVVGDADGLVVVRREEALEVAAESMLFQPIGIGMAKDQPKLTAKINEVLRQLDESGELNKIWDKWLGPNTEYNMSRTDKVVPLSELKFDEIP